MYEIELIKKRMHDILEAYYFKVKNSQDTEFLAGEYQGLYYCLQLFQNMHANKHASK